MNINFFKLNELSAADKKKLLRRAEVDIEQLQAQVKPIIQDVKENGDSAIVKYSKKFDAVDIKPEELKVKDSEFEKASLSLDSLMKEVIKVSAENIRKFHESQMPVPIWFTELSSGVMAGEKITPVNSVGIYVPRGKGSFPSVMLMLCIPAKIAGVKKIIVCTPPQKDGTVDDASLVAAEICGVKEIYKAGGVQAIAGMAYGTETIAKVDKIIGPGSSYVSAAKRLLFGTVDVGLPAGPSESVILADEKADPKIAALDLLIEAEHGPDSTALLVTHSEKLGQEVKKLLPQLIEKLPENRKNFCISGFSNYGGIIITESIEESIDFVNDFAPEHLEVLIEEPMSILGKIENAGEIMLGKYAPLTISNFSLGPNSTLPTGGFAKTFSAVSVHDFLKRSSIGYLTKQGYDTLKDVARKFAEYEGFPAHAMAITERKFD
ncbi:MAG TPA: histidinol dehydrogenase [Thermodesulfovibrionia bacterium]|nr:histidinol dehydrogenase [Thermodesulfovibrionia bacterium]